MMVFLFYGVPCTVYSLYCLLLNMKTPLLVDVSMLFAGLTANVSSLCSKVEYYGFTVTNLVRNPDRTVSLSMLRTYFL